MVTDLDGAVRFSWKLAGACVIGLKRIRPPNPTARSPPPPQLDRSQQPTTASPSSSICRLLYLRAFHWPPAGLLLLVAGRGGHGEETAAGAGAGAEARRRRAHVGAAVAVGQDGLLPRCHARLAPARLRAAPARHHSRPRPPAGAPLRAPPRRGRHTVPILPPGRARPGAGVRLPVLPRRPARRLRRARPAHPLRVHGVRGRRRVLVGGGAERRSVRVLRASQGRGRATVPRLATGERRGRTGAHALAVPVARGRAPRRGVPDQLPRAPPSASLQDRRRGRTPERRPPNTERAEAV